MTTSTRVLNAAALLCGTVCHVPLAMAQDTNSASFREDLPSMGAISDLGEDWGWIRVGPIGGGPMSDVSIHPSKPSVYALVALSGEVWLTRDGGGTWVTVLPGVVSSLGDLSVEEEVQLQVEARIEEFDADGVDLDDLGEVDPTEFEGDPDGLEAALEALEAQADELADQAEEAARVAAEEVLTELQADPWFLEQQDVLGGALDAARPQVLLTPTGDLVVIRADGIWLSRDQAESWDQVLRDVAVLSLLPRDNGWVAGTTDGLRYADAALANWTDLDDGTEGLRVLALAHADGTTYAGTDRGLWRTDAKGRWSAVSGVEVPVLAVLADPSWPGGLWAATARTVLRSDARGEALREPLGALVPGVRAMVWLGPGRLVAAGTEGAWASEDGGTTWSPVARGLSDPNTRGLALQGATLLVASNDGLLRLGPLDTRTGDGAADERRLEGFVPVHLLLDAALGRPELTTRVGSRWGASALPTVTIEGRVKRDDQLLYVVETGSSRRLGSEWTVLARLQWTPSSQQGGSTLTYIDGDDVSVLVGSAQASAVGALGRGATEYRSRLASRVAEMHAARAELLSDPLRVRRSSVLDQTLHELRVAEIEAQIDVLTDGAVSRWRVGGG